MRNYRFIFMIALLCIACQLLAEITVSQADGGSVEVKPAGWGKAILNGGSTLNRTWYFAHDDSMPIAITGTPGLKLKQNTSSNSVRPFMYETEYEISTNEHVTAVKVRFVTFDVWGNRAEAFVANEITDIIPNVPSKLEGSWYCDTYSEASDYFVCFGYVDKVRTKSGKVIEADPEAIVNELQKLAYELTVSDLEVDKKD